MNTSINMTMRKSAQPGASEDDALTEPQRLTGGVGDPGGVGTGGTDPESCPPWRTPKLVKCFVVHVHWRGELLVLVGLLSPFEDQPYLPGTS